MVSHLRALDCPPLLHYYHWWACRCLRKVRRHHSHSRRHHLLLLLCRVRPQRCPFRPHFRCRPRLLLSRRPPSDMTDSLRFSSRLKHRAGRRSCQRCVYTFSKFCAALTLLLLFQASFGERAQRHLRLFFGGLFAILSRLSPVVQSISALLILIYLVQFSGDVVVDFFALTPGEFISPGQWYHTIISLWSHAFLETRIYSLIVDLLILFFCSSLIEPLWGHREVSQFYHV